MKEEIKKPKLPPRLKSLEKDIETRSGRRIRYKVDENLPGDGRTDLDFIIWLRNKSAEHQVVAHELCHLKLRVEGYPTIRTRVTPKIIKNTIDIMYNIVEHQLIKPALQEMGYHLNEDEAVQKLIKQLAGYQPHSIGDECFLHKLIAVLYAKIILECNADTLKNCLEFFNEEEIKMGEKIINCVRTNDFLKKKNVESLYEEIGKILGIRGCFEVSLEDF